jgi:hypothetical protein
VVYLASAFSPLSSSCTLAFFEICLRRNFSPLYQ